MLSLKHIDARATASGLDVCVRMDRYVIMTMREEVMNSREMEAMLQELDLESREIGWKSCIYNKHVENFQIQNLN